jgi:hypothetical protein
MKIVIDVDKIVAKTAEIGTRGYDKAKKLKKPTMSRFRKAIESGKKAARRK